jgi:hypothetical protein
LVSLIGNLNKGKIMELINSNVMSVSEKLQKKLGVGTNPDRIATTLQPLIDKMVMKYPTWKYRATDVQGYTMSGTSGLSGIGYEVVRLVVFENGVEIGSISRTYSGGDHKMGISNDRIAKKRHRTDTYSTGNVDKAMLAIKKTFSKPNVEERVDKVYKEAIGVIRDVYWQKDRECDTAKGVVQEEATKYVFKEGFPAFMEHLKTMNKLKLIDKQAEMVAEMQTIQAVRKLVDDREATLIILDGGNYIVKKHGGVSIIPSADLPEDMKAKLGMLKLVEPEQFVSGVGARVSTESFVLVDGGQSA